MSERVLVIGQSGQLGQSLSKIANEYPNFSFEFVQRQELDLASTDSIENFFKDLRYPYHAIINAAAYIAVDNAETEINLSDQINHLAVKQLADIANQQGSILLHVSTDYVFDGKNYKPWIETDSVDPINAYGRSKLAGERAMIESGCSGSIVRTSWVYSEFGHNFVKTMLRLGQERESLSVIFDQVGTPTYATDLARALVELLSRHQKKQDVELYHFSNEGVCSWYDFSMAIFELSNIACNVTPIESSSYPTPAARPHYSVLNKTKIKQKLNLDIPNWRNSLKECLAILNK